jgi:hypothetical protein
MRRSLALLLAMAPLTPSTGLAQSQPRPTGATEPTVLGIVVGYNRSEGLWTPESESESVGGVMLGGFVNAKTPVSWFSVRAELLWVQRGNDVMGSIEGEPLVGGVRSDYVTISVHPRASVGVGPIRLHVAAGPTLDQLISSRLDTTLGSAALADVGTVFGVGAGVGIGATVGRRYRVEVEGRVFEGLGDAYSGDFVAMRHRSYELVARVGIPRPAR